MKFKRGTWFTSDLHLGHWNCNFFCNRGFKTLTEMNDSIIDNINSYVKENDKLYIIGDLIWTTENYDILKRFNCKNIYLIRGNHCDSNYNKFYNQGIRIVCEEMVIKIGKIRVLLSHYPYKYRFFKALYSNIKNFIKSGYWPSKNRYKYNPIDNGNFLIHGHRHQGLIINGRQFNVAWDLHKRPINIQEIESFIQKFLKLNSNSVKI
jgi:calcineurin-like phosphoesterase family protein